jgi:hypothetical protein
MKPSLASHESTKKINCRIIAWLVIALSLALLDLGCARKVDQTIKIDSEYIAIFLENGQVYFGKLEQQGPAYLLLTDVFYVQRQVFQDKADPEKKEVKSTLIRRGNEWHAPDRMYINTSHVVVIEPVSDNSRVAQLIKEAKAQRPAEQH